MHSFFSIFANLFRKVVTKHFKLSLVTLSVLSAIGYVLTALWVFLWIPDDYLQGSLVKIMYIHVPCAWISLASYITLGFISVFYLMYSDKLSSAAMSATTIVSLNASFITLVTGSIWGKAAWGTWWIWDPRLTAVFIQFCLLSVAHILKGLSDGNRVLEQSSALLIIIGLINIPIIKFAVNAWNSIHQDSSVMRFEGIKIHPDLFYPLVLAFFSILFFYAGVGLAIARNSLNEMKKYTP
jgi:heme exporter protein C